jgi:putative transposase
MNERRACQVIGCQRMTVRYRSRRRDDPKLRERLMALARERRHFGYRRLLIFLRREGFVVNHKRLFRLYREERLMVRKRGGRNALWAPGRRCRCRPCRTSCGCWTSSPISWSAGDGSASWRSSTSAPGAARWRSPTLAAGKRVVRELDLLIAQHGKPTAIGSDNSRRGRAR